MGSLSEVTGDRDLTTLSVAEILELHAGTSREAIKETLDRMAQQKADLASLTGRLEAQNHALERLVAAIDGLKAEKEPVQEPAPAPPAVDPPSSAATEPRAEPEAPEEPEERRDAAGSIRDGAPRAGHGRKPATQHASKTANHDRAER